MSCSYGWVLGQKFPKQGSFFGRFSFDNDVFDLNSQEIVKMGNFLPKFIIVKGTKESFGN